MSQPIPKELISAAIAMFTPYCDGLTSARLEALLSSTPASTGLKTVKSVATTFNVSEKTVRRMIDDGRLEAVKLSAGTLRVYGESIDKLLAKGA